MFSLVQNENWRPIEGFPGYEVSDLGRVRSLRKVLKPSKRRSYTGRLVKVVVNLGRGNMRSVHSLVLGAFVGPRPPGLQGCHGDGNPENNAVDNLRWDTAKGNQADSIAHGTKVKPPVLRGEAHARAKLTAAAVRIIRAQPQRRGVLAELSRQFGVSNQTILRVRRGGHWAHV